MRADLPAGVGQAPQLRPVHTAQLRLVLGAEPGVDAVPRHRLGPARPSGGHEHRAGHAKALHDRERELEDRPVRVVERHGDPAAGRGVRHGALERGGLVAAAQQQLELGLEQLGGGRQIGGPVVAERVVAEDEHIGHGPYPAAGDGAAP